MNWTEHPLPIEQIDPELGAHLLAIAQHQHAVRLMHIGIGFRRYQLRSGKEIVNRTERNQSCPCGSGLKFKRCHGK